MARRKYLCISYTYGCGIKISTAQIVLAERERLLMFVSNFDSTSAIKLGVGIIEYLKLLIEIPYPHPVIYYNNLSEMSYIKKYV